MVGAYLLIVPGRGLVDAFIVDNHDDLVEAQEAAVREGGVLATLQGVRDYRPQDAGAGP
jgi:hypothetical protein